MTTLTSLRLAVCYKITDEGGLKELGKLSSLTSLSLVSCYKITDEGLKEQLGKLSSLTSLSLAPCLRITATGGLELENVLNLTLLRLGRTSKITVMG